MTLISLFLHSFIHPFNTYRNCLMHCILETFTVVSSITLQGKSRFWTQRSWHPMAHEADLWGVRGVVRYIIWRFSVAYHFHLGPQACTLSVPDGPVDVMSGGKFSRFLSSLSRPESVPNNIILCWNLLLGSRTEMYYFNQNHDDLIISLTWVYFVTV